MALTPDKLPARITFTARPYQPRAEQGAWCFVVVPAKVHAALGGARGRIPIKLYLGTSVFQTSAMPFEGNHCFMFNAQMRAAAGKEAGQLVKFVLEVDRGKRVVKVPADFARALKASPLARARFNALAFSHRKAHVEAILAAKRPETRSRRIAGAVAMLAGSK